MRTFERSNKRLKRKPKPRIYNIDLEIKKRREIIGMTQKELAELANIPSMTLCDIEQCISTNPTIDTLF